MTLIREYKYLHGAPRECLEGLASTQLGKVFLFFCLAGGT